MYPRYSLVLMVTHACNLRCTYCYTGEKTARVMSSAIGRKAIDRALASITPGGTLELGFFGGEPLLEAGLISSLIDHAREHAAGTAVTVDLNMTTNGTVATPEAWALMMRPDLSLAVSCDGIPTVHDRHRCTPAGHGSSGRVVDTLRRLIEAGRDIQVILVVRPDTLEALPDGLRFLAELGVRHLEPSLDVWAQWTPGDVARLERVVSACADVWRDGLPHRSIGWFDEKAAQLARLPMTPTARCGFGRGEIAVAPSGRLYPCERLIGDGLPGSPMALAGHALEGDDFLAVKPAEPRSDENCDACAMLAMCNTFCRCSNYVRTGSVRRPDRLLCAWNQACLIETARVLRELSPTRVSANAEVLS